jgi:potassium efflux system protein
VIDGAYMYKKTSLKFLISISVIIFCWTNAYSQNATDSIRVKKKTADSLSSFTKKMNAFAERLKAESERDVETDMAEIAQDKAFDVIRQSLQKATLYLKGGIDSLGIAKQLSALEKDFLIASDGVLVKKGTAQTSRNLTATANIINELLNKSLAIRAALSTHHQNLTSFRFQLDSLSNNPVLLKFPKDSAGTVKYLQHLMVVAYQVSPVDSSIKIAASNVRTLLNRSDMIALKLQAGLEEVHLYQRKMAFGVFNREFGNIWEPVGYARPFSEILAQAKAKGQLNLLFFAGNNTGKLFVVLLLIITCFIYLRSLKAIYIEKELLNKDFDGQLVLRYPLLSALVMVINIFQFLFLSPPFILNILFWTIAAISLSFVFRNYINKYWYHVWLIMFGLFLLSAADNLILQASRTERWFMLCIALAGFLVGAVVLWKGRIGELREKWMIYSIALMTFIEFGSVTANVFGRYNLSKTLMVSGFINVVIAILFLWTVRLINEGLFLAFNVYTRQEKKLFYLNFQRVGNQAPVFFYVALVIGWIILFGRNFAGFNYIAGPLQDFFTREHTVGDYTFSINKLLLFAVIIAISVLVSKVVSFFASDGHVVTDKHNTDTRRGVGSWLLLIRIVILGLGLFLAIAAAGIPVDRLTIVLGALGVGIGFGLQTLVNNLVSGLIIAFEKPVNVGDVVEIGGQGGTMKSIGFRSSVISTWEGADLIMPNGDLLSSHLTNWTLGGSHKRVSILIGVAYDADLNKVREILNGILEREERVHHNPAPVVQYEQFSNSSIDVKIYFWTRQMKDSAATKSDLIIAIQTAFAVEGISIPYPQQDVYLHRVNDQ